MSSDPVSAALARLRELASGGEAASMRDAAALRRELGALADELERATVEAQTRFSATHDDLIFAQRRAKVGTWDFDLHSRKGNWSDYMFELFGCDREKAEPPFAEFLELIHPEDRATIAAEQQRAVAGEPPRAFDLRTNPDRVPARVLSCVIESVEGGRLLRGTNVDVTAQRRMSAALQAANDRLTHLLDSAPYTVLTIERDSTITYANRVPTGWPLDLVGSQFPDLIEPDSHAAVEAGVRALFDRGSEMDLEVRVTFGPWMELRATPMRGPDGVASALVFLVDVTERREAAEARRQLEGRMQHAQKLESLGVLAGGIAHDFNNLLVGVLASAELARYEVPADSGAAERLEDIVAAANRAADLCRQMLAYAGKGRFVISSIQLGAVVSDMAHLLRVSKSAAVTLRFDVDSELPAIEADVSQIRQVVMNLLTNASDAVDGAGVITVSAGAGNCDATYLAACDADEGLQPGRFVWLEVADDGCGMDERTRHRMFEPFFTSKEAGRGLGLAAAIGIVRRHGGAIRVESEPGRGTAVRCLFPASDVVAKAGPPSREPTPVRSRKATILVVDDQAVVRKTAKAVLIKAGYDVVVAVDGAQGVAELTDRRGEIDLVILDVTMPEMDGNTALQHMQRVDPAVKVIFMSGYDERAVAQDHVGRGRAGFLRKPFTPNTMLRAVDEILGLEFER